MLMLEEKGFRFVCSMSDELADDGNVKGRVLEQVFFVLDTQDHLFEALPSWPSHLHRWDL
jgi:hypothetical protein